MGRESFWRAQGERFAATYRQPVEDALEHGEAILAVAPSLRAKKLLTGAGFVTDRRLLLVSRDGVPLSWEPDELAVKEPTRDGIRVQFPDGAVALLDAGDKARNLSFGAAVYGLVLRPSNDPPAVVWSGDVTYVAGHGTALVVGAPYRALVRGSGAVEVRALDDSVVYGEPEPVELHVSGPGEYTIGGGWMGGGFGLSGAIKGAVMADVLNAITSRREVSTLLRVSTHESIVVLESRSVGTDELAAALSAPIQAAVRRVSATSLGQAREGDKPDLVDRLARLAELHATGALSDDEFVAAKGRLLDGT